MTGPSAVQPGPGRWVPHVVVGPAGTHDVFDDRDASAGGLVGRRAGAYLDLHDDGRFTLWDTVTKGWGRYRFTTDQLVLIGEAGTLVGSQPDASPRSRLVEALGHLRSSRTDMLEVDGPDRMTVGSRG